MRSRSFRRAQKERMRQKAKRIAKNIFRDPATEAWVKFADNLKPCSCEACGNPRKHFLEETRQEELNKREIKEFFKELKNGYN